MKPFNLKELTRLSQPQLFQFKLYLEKFFYTAGTNVAFWNAYRHKKSQLFRKKIHQALKKQVVGFSTLDNVSQVTKTIGKESSRNIAVAVGAMWLAFHTQIIGGTEAVLLYLLWAGEQGGQAGLDKMVPQRQFQLNNLVIQAQMAERVSFLNKVLDRTSIGWVADIIDGGIKNNLSNTEIVRALRQQVNQMATERADLITETELITAMNVVEIETYRRNGIQKHKWRTSLDERVCPVCLENEDAGAIPIGEEFPSGVIMVPAHARCRCYLLPVLPEFIEGTIWTGA